MLKKIAGRVKVNVIFLAGNERGTALVLVALALVGLLGCTALVTDAGLLYSHRARLVNAADAAALAGVQELPARPEEAQAVARAYAEANGVPPDQVEVEVADDRRSLTVRPRRTVQLLFARVLGFASQEMRAAATATVAPLTGAAGVVPFGIDEQELIFGREYVLKEGAGSGGASEGEDGRMHGWYGALDPDNNPGGGARAYKERIKYGYQGVLRVGDIILTEAGNMSGPTGEGVAYRIAQCTEGCTFESFARNCPRLVIVPVVRVVESQGGHPKRVEVRGFAAFFLEGVEGQGNENNVIGRFVRTVYPGEVEGGGDDYGLYAVRLIH